MTTVRNKATKKAKTKSTSAAAPLAVKDVPHNAAAKGTARVRVGLLGLGTVGAGVAEIIREHGELIAQRTGVTLEITRAHVRRPRLKRQGAAGAVPTTTDAAAVIAADDVDVVCELMGGLEPARTAIVSALQAGKPVVTANKAVLAKFGPQLFEAGRQAARGIYFEAAVAGGIPIIRTMREGLASDRITAITGILNGTTNFILGEMEAGSDFATALSQAQAKGYAEADPTLDINGRDAGDKLTILLQLAFGLTTDPENVPVEGITTLGPEVMADAKELGYRVKLLALGKRHTDSATGKELIDARVHPAFVPLGHMLSTVPAAQNAILVHSDALGSTLYQGPGAGGMPTGSAVVADLIEAGRDLHAGIGPQPLPKRRLQTPKLLRPEKAESAFYVRLLVSDEPGVLASVTHILGLHDISLSTVLQRERGTALKKHVPVVLTTHATTFGAMGKALGAVRRLKAVQGDVRVLPIEEDQA